MDEKNEIKPPLTVDALVEYIRTLEHELAQAKGVIANLKEARGRDLQVIRALEARVRDFVTRLGEKDREILDALTDETTTLPTRRAFAKACMHQLAGARRSNRPTCALFLDLDHFKLINDTHGHHIGDKILARVGEAVGKCIRENDLAGRYGGEEFVVLLDDVRESGALEIAERIRSAVEHIVVNHGKEKVRVTTSIGVAVWDHEMDFNVLIKRADKAMYDAKQDGRNCVRVYCHG